MAGRGNKKHSYNTDENMIWHLAAYGRRSFDDCDDNESNTIINQRRQIEEFVANNKNIIIEDYYMDDGYTGTIFNRPGFNRMMQDITNGKINGIIVKDLSRLGRNHKEAGKYIEEIFPIYNLRIIALNDKVDSYLDPESINSLIVPIKNLMNENYSKDISKKVSSAYVTMAKSGQYVSGTPPYGYMIDPNDKHHLIIDEKEANVVKKIFDMALNGDGRIKICKYLNNNGILCRKEIQRRKKKKLSMDPFDVLSESYWGTTTIGRMLSSETYIGNLVQLKTKRSSFGVNKFVVKEKDSWIKTENTHEPIISKDDFDKVQKIIKSNEYKRKREPSSYSIFNGLLKCSDCGRAMMKQEDNRKKYKISNYFCSTHLRASNQCTSHKIKTSELEEIVLETIQLQVKLIIELDKSITKLIFKSSKEEYEEEYKNNIKVLEIKINNLRDMKRRLYEQWKFQDITEHDFKIQSIELEDKIKSLTKEIELCESSHLEAIKKIRKNEYWISHYKRNRKIKKLNKTILNELIDSIIVFEEGKVEIVFKYNDEYLNLLHYLESEGVIVDEKMGSRSLLKTIV